MHSNFILYRHTSPSGKVYIGITSQTPSQRWRGGEGYRHNGYFYRAIKKYGWDAFAHEILFDSLTKAEACAMEADLIRRHRSNEEAFGYNLTTGGEGCPGGVKSDDFRQGQREKTLTLWGDPEYRAHMVAVHRGKKQTQATIDRRRVHLIGHSVSEATRKRISEANKGTAHRMRAIICVETGMEFATIKDAAAWAGVARPGINLCAQGKQKTAGGYHWRYLEED